MKTVDEKTVAIGISFSAQVDERRTIVFQTCVPLDCPVEHLNAVADKLEQAATRQEAFHEINHLKKDLKIRQAQLKDLTEDVDRLDKQAERALTLGSTRHMNKSKDDVLRDAAARDNALATLAKAKENISRVEEAIAEQKVRYHATPSSADCSASSSNS